MVTHARFVTHMHKRTGARSPEDSFVQETLSLGISHMRHHSRGIYLLQHFNAVAQGKHVLLGVQVMQPNKSQNMRLGKQAVHCIKLCSPHKLYPVPAHAQE